MKIRRIQSIVKSVFVTLIIGVLSGCTIFGSSSSSNSSMITLSYDDSVLSSSVQQTINASDGYFSFHMTSEDLTPFQGGYQVYSQSKSTDIDSFFITFTKSIDQQDTVIMGSALFNEILAKNDISSIHIGDYTMISEKLYMVVTAWSLNKYHQTQHVYAICKDGTFEEWGWNTLDFRMSEPTFYHGVNDSWLLFGYYAGEYITMSSYHIMNEIATYTKLKYDERVGLSENSFTRIFNRINYWGVSVRDNHFDLVMVNPSKGTYSYIYFRAILNNPENERVDFELLMLDRTNDPRKLRFAILDDSKIILRQVKVGFLTISDTNEIEVEYSLKTEVGYNRPEYHFLITDHHFITVSFSQVRDGIFQIGLAVIGAESTLKIFSLDDGRMITEEHLCSVECTVMPFELHLIENDLFVQFKTGQSGDRSYMSTASIFGHLTLPIGE